MRKRIVLPVALVVVPRVAAGCGGGAAPADAMTDVPAPVCVYDPARPASDPCRAENLGGEGCVFNREPDGGIECFLV